MRGLEYVKLALEVAAAGSHNLLLIGAPGSGKSMIARRLPTILPPLDEDEALQTSMIYSAAGKLDGASLIRRRPFRAPHQDVSLAGLVGGGAGIPKPGEISLAHNGVLFLDELPEMKRTVLEALRQPLEERRVTIVRARHAIEFPASFALVAAMNPCPCGYYGSALRNCICDTGSVRRYRGRISGPLLDRLDLQVEVPQVDYKRAHRRARRRAVGARARARARGARDSAAALRRQRPARQRADGHPSRSLPGADSTRPRRTTSDASCRSAASAPAACIASCASPAPSPICTAKTAIEREHLQCAIDFRALDQELR